MDGYKATQQIKATTQGQVTAVIALTAGILEEDRAVFPRRVAMILSRQKSQEAGCNDFIPKPIQSEELLEKIQNYLGVVWITKSLDESTTISEEIEEIIVPPPDELVTLYKAAQIGDIVGVEVEANRLRQLAPNYVAFANRLLQLAQEFEEEEILKLVEQYILE